jgi:hypothetical protein
MPKYRNLVIGGFHPTTWPAPALSTLPVCHWRQIGNILDRPEQLDLPPSVRASGGIWAPTLRGLGL